MAVPTDNPTFRGTFFGPVMSRLQADIAMVRLAAQDMEGAYTEAHFATISEALDSAYDALDAAETANYASGNPS